MIINNPRQVAITLSRRNLLTLLAKLNGHPENSSCTLIKVSELGALSVRAEEDAPHYGDETPGAIDPATEAVIKEMLK